MSWSPGVCFWSFCSSNTEIWSNICHEICWHRLCLPDDSPFPLWTLHQLFLSTIQDCLEHIAPKWVEYFDFNDQFPSIYLNSKYRKIISMLLFVSNTFKLGVLNILLLSTTCSKTDANLILKCQRNKKKREKPCVELLLLPRHKREFDFDCDCSSAR